MPGLIASFLSAPGKLSKPGPGQIKRSSDMKPTLGKNGVFWCVGLCALFFGGLSLGCRSTAGGSAPIRAVELTVAADGSGQFTNVQAAIMSVLSGGSTNPVIIHLKPGIYKELIYVQREKRFFKLMGEDPAKTVITYDLSAYLTNLDGKPLGTFHTPTATIDADDFTTENITFENSAGASAGPGRPRGRGPRGVSPLPFSGLAGHGAVEPRPAVF